MPAFAAVLPSRPAPRQRWPAVLGLGAAVLVLHALLIPALRPERPPRAGLGQRPPPALQVRALPARTTWPRQPGQRAEALPGAPAPAVESSVAAPPQPPPPTRPTRQRQVAVRNLDTPQAHSPRTPLTGPPAAPTGDTSAAPTPAAASEALDLADADRADATPGAPPPVYATHLPPPVLLRYALRYNGREGEATLAWRRDGGRWSLQLDGRGPAGQPLVEQASEGGVDHAGLAPERLLDRRAGRRWRAAHFRRDTGSITFSGSASAYPAWPGAQDRLSWLAQMAAILAADPAAGAVADGPAELRLFVVDAVGHGALWHFVAQGEQRVDTPLGPRPAQLWRREPPRPEGLRVEAWLDAARDHWPLQLRFTAPRSGHVFELRLAAEPASP